MSIKQDHLRELNPAKKPAFDAAIGPCAKSPRD